MEADGVLPVRQEAAMRLIPALCVILATSSMFAAPGAGAAEKPSLEIAKQTPMAVSPEAVPSPLKLVYTPIVPCRVFFTPTAIAANSSVTLKITGSGNLSSQGGPAKGCGIPSYAKAVSINVTATTATSTGTLKLSAAGAAPSAFTSVSYRTGVNITSPSIVALSASGQITAASTGQTKVVGDVTGYFEAQLHATVESDGTLLDSSGRVVSVVKSGTGRYDITFNRPVTGCGLATSSPNVGFVVAVGNNDTFVTVGTSNASGASADSKFRLVVMC